MEERVIFKKAYSICVTLKLDIRSVLIHLEGFLVDRFHYQRIKFVGIHRPDCASRTYGQPDHLGYCTSSSPRFENGSHCPDFSRMAPPHTYPSL
ncbi:hypothetical protein AVEN_114341-1 [Araneus ventricosus]|uniref:Uncharacterized protein n=1 Tax=Araneus ventricosus TaxID=182803 RepID=A0A4Y2VGN2_ARAVE|nr:hypothetical protein AVEN_25446-1 [Araneus ventricosus]GBO23642.1 hypothetical protein AVEN_114341-1 [Araneus ventricosus]